MAWLDHQERKNPDTGAEETYWSIQDRVAGKKLKKSLGFISEKEAQRLLKIYEGDKARGVTPSAPKAEERPQSPPAPQCPTLREWWGEGRPWPKTSRMYAFFQARGVSPSTMDIADAARLLIIEEMGHIRLDQFKTAEGDAFVVALRERGLKSRSIQLYVTQLQRSLEVAAGDGLIPTFPKLQRPKLNDSKTHRFHTPEQSERFMTVLFTRMEKGDVDSASYLAIFMTLSLGMRPGEALSRRWEDIDWRGGGKILIQRQAMPDGSLWQPKTRTARTVPFTPPLLMALKETWLQTGRPSTGWIFPSTVVPGWPLSNYRRALKTSCRLADVPELHPHALRHTAATRWAWSGVDRPTAMRLGGWKSAEMLDEVYAHTDESRMEEVMRTTAVGQR